MSKNLAVASQVIVIIKTIQKFNNIEVQNLIDLLWVNGGRETTTGEEKMVAISLYRGNLHRVPDVPRRWLMPTPKISLKDFKILLNRRARALSRLQSSTSSAADDGVATTSNPNPNLKKEVEEDRSNQPELDLQQQKQQQEELMNRENGSKLLDDFQVKTVDDLERLISDNEVKVQRRSDGDDCLGKLDDAAGKVELPENGVQQEEEKEISLNPNPETHKDGELSDKEKRKKEVEEKLQILNARKHNLVQVLKQILSAEEELRRRSNVQEITAQPSISLQVDVTNECGSISRHVTPRPSSEGHNNGDMEVADADDGLNQNIRSRSLPRMSISPSSDSLHRRPAFSAVQNPSRATLGVAISPSRFAPTPPSQQLNPTNLPTVSVSGTNYVASSPSPAGSGGTSVFRDARLPSPWN